MRTSNSVVMRKGVTTQKFNKDTAAYLEKHGWERVVIKPKAETTKVKGK